MHSCLSFSDDLALDSPSSSLSPTAIVTLFDYPPLHPILIPHLRRPFLLCLRRTFSQRRCGFLCSNSSNNTHFSTNRRCKGCTEFLSLRTRKIYCQHSARQRFLSGYANGLRM
ncbi:uncharacterized protein LOC127249966 isoform X2 [Andrographis paniculata]|uniref:uncharacterized protein LOC127249966 isoform X2 n=1 Tax=Andrographis paniculata TaxID=175694 RepID=UPI0021E8419D|nr:uncharacterized protein LOC127249966 isoform X2 [Andrographis paniculata]